MFLICGIIYISLEVYIGVYMLREMLLHYSPT